jgi:hypothetical protein
MSKNPSMKQLLTEWRQLFQEGVEPGSATGTKSTVATIVGITNEMEARLGKSMPALDQLKDLAQRAEALVPAWEDVDLSEYEGNENAISFHKEKYDNAYESGFKWTKRWFGQPEYFPPSKFSSMLWEKFNSLALKELFPEFDALRKSAEWQELLTALEPSQVPEIEDPRKNSWENSIDAKQYRDNLHRFDN